jgi:signal transduction histidine kinase
MALIFSIVGTEIEDNIKREIKRDYRDLVQIIESSPDVGINAYFSDLIDSTDYLETLYILKDDQGVIIASNYPYDTDMGKGWVRLRKVNETPAQAKNPSQTYTFMGETDYYGKNSDAQAYIGWNDRIGSYSLFVGQGLARIDETKAIVSRIAALVIPISMFLAFLGGLIFNRMTMRRIEVINEHCRSIRAQGDLSLRVPNTQPDDEYGLLIANLNAMLDNIDKGVQNIQAVSDDVAHDLRTPLGRLKYNLEAGLADSKATTESLKVILEDALVEIDNLLETFSAILRISQLKSKKRKSKFQNFDLSALVDTFYQAYGPSAEDAGHTMHYEASSESCMINGDKEMVGQLLSNLIENALHHATGPNHENLDIRLALNYDPSSVTLSVEDNGRGVPKENHNQVFNKFFRGDYDRQEPGNGLGLALVKAVADLHDAQVQLVAVNPGVKFLVTFPRLTSTGL